MFEAALANGAERPLIYYFDGVLTMRDVDERANALAKVLMDNGIAFGDRVAIFTQNNPAFVIGLIATWKVGGIGVPINPMYTARELTFSLIDTGARALVVLDSLYDDVARGVVESGETDVEVVVTTSADDWRGSAKSTAAQHDAYQLTELPGAARIGTGKLKPHDPAVLMYTSGTTGVPKATINTHSNFTAGAEYYRRWMELDADDVVLGLTPLFHITGLIGHVALSLRLGAPLILTHRFSVDGMLDAIRLRRPTFVIGTISALVALADASSPADFSSIRRLGSGGAAISPRLAGKIEAAVGQPLTVVYGLTETTSPALATPLGTPIPVDSESGALSIGVPVYDTVVRIVDELGADVGAGEIGELAISGPQVAAGYWQQPEATGESFPDAELRTGDVGFVDADGWTFLIDRKKDMITSAGYKVWPREVEEVLYRHPDVAEAAVVGVPDDVRGESVTAFVALEPGRRADADALMAYAREQLAAYKRPRRIVLTGALPKTSSGKILRRVLRDSEIR
ncbi:long-chain fatty acid--CoA ligase [Gordonia sp. TBRC 11910]|uniref:Long-chain fatty acid--CoA ligase n=2 Tax=Gordonia asplenii TaxID=2725283 RepID=A0A848KYU2_9ACTN|nr:long-chain fatty acid--CoA ligase [Gordonia asplenii]